jgi:hypothetical protein
MRTDVPVTKYRHVEQMPRTPRSDDSELVERITTLWRRASRLASPTVEPGVRRFRTIEEANDARSEATLRRMRELREPHSG